VVEEVEVEGGVEEGKGRGWRSEGLFRREMELEVA